MRLFVGTFLSDSDRARLAQFQKDFVDADRFNSKIAWVKEGKLHQTWCFLGEVEESRVTNLMSVLEEAAQSFRASRRAFRHTSSSNSSAPEKESSKLVVRFDRVELWPRPGNARTLVICPSSIPPQVEELAQIIRAATKEFLDTQQLDKHEGFKPHITIARFRRRQKSTQRTPERQSSGRKPTTSDFTPLSQMLPVELEIAQFDLIHSHLGSTKEEYQSLRGFLCQ